MVEKNDNGTHQLDTAEMARSLAEVAEGGQRVIAEFIERNALDTPINNPDPLNIGTAFVEMTAKLISDPQKLVQANFSLWQNYMSLWQSTTRRLLGDEPAPVVVPDASDRRFKDEMWQANEIFDFIKQSYLLSSRWIQELVHGVEGLDEQSSRKVDFYTRQFVDAIAPSNFVLTNPEVLR
jgi:polyhydroxyalkanoate synthase